MFVLVPFYVIDIFINRFTQSNLYFYNINVILILDKILTYMNINISNIERNKDITITKMSILYRKKISFCAVTKMGVTKLSLFCSYQIVSYQNVSYQNGRYQIVTFM